MVTSTGETFLIPAPREAPTATSRLYPLKDLEAALSRLKIKQKVFIFDGSILKLYGDRHSKTQGPLWHTSTESVVQLIGTSGIGKSLELGTCSVMACSPTLSFEDFAGMPIRIEMERSPWGSSLHT